MAPQITDPSDDVSRLPPTLHHLLLRRTLPRAPAIGIVPGILQDRSHQLPTALQTVNLGSIPIFSFEPVGQNTPITAILIENWRKRNYPVSAIGCAFSTLYRYVTSYFTVNCATCFMRNFSLLRGNGAARSVGVRQCEKRQDLGSSDRNATPDLNAGCVGRDYFVKKITNCLLASLTTHFSSIRLLT
jgi:hypothetical protein